MPKKIIISVFTILILLLLSIRESKTPDERFFYSQIKKILSTQDQSIPLKELTTFEWEKAYYVGPYTQSNNGSIWLNGKNYILGPNIEVEIKNDGLWALLFIQSTTVTHIIHSKSFMTFPLKRYYLTFNPDIQLVFYYPDDTLKVEEKIFQLRKNK